MEFPEPELDDAPESFAEDAAAHLRCSELAVHEYEGNLNQFETELPGCVFHFNLEAVTFHAHIVEIYGGEGFAAVALESGSSVMDFHPQDSADVHGGIVGHKDPAEGPVDNADAVTVT